ncbi:MAG: GAF domain-containing protein [Magnetococcales bacterium]|nr:GAF domain-containing protein [Magnetococcales bacterium]
MAEETSTKEGEGSPQASPNGERPVAAARRGGAAGEARRKAALAALRRRTQGAAPAVAKPVVPAKPATAQPPSVAGKPSPVKKVPPNKGAAAEARRKATLAALRKRTQPAGAQAQSPAAQAKPQPAVQSPAAQANPPPPVGEPSHPGVSQLALLQHEVKYLRFSRDLTREFVESSGSMKKVMKVIFTRVLEVLDAEAGSLWLKDENSEQNICHLAEGDAKSRIIGLRLPLGQGIVGQVIEKNDSDVVLDCTEDQRFAADIDKKSGFQTQSMICVPLKDGDHAFGAIQIINKKSGFQKQFTEGDQRLVEDMALSAAIAVRNARLLESESRVNEMNTLNELSRQISSSLDLDTVLDMVVNKVDELADVSDAAIALINENKKDKLFMATLAGGQQVDPEDEDVKDLLEMMEQVRKAGRTTYVANAEKFIKENTEEDNIWVKYLERHEIKSVWSTPLADDEDTLGVLWLESESINFAPKITSDVLNILATQTTVTLRNASLYKKIPFADVLGKVGEKSTAFVSGWRRWAMIGGAVVGIIACLHYFPIFRSVDGPCTVETRFGKGVYLRVAGRVKEVLVKEGDRVKAGQVMARLDDEPVRLSLIEAESKLALLERQIIEAKAASDASAMSRAVIERIAARAEARKARDDLAKVEVRAEMDGIMLTARTEELLGRDFGIGSEVLRIADPTKFSIVVELPEEDLLDVKNGQEVRGVLRSRPGKGFRGTVRHVGRAYSIPAEALEEGVTDTSAPEGFVAEVTITESDVALLPGMTGQAMISTPQTSYVTRKWRRFVNIFAFWFGG